ncbi:hypothetical protein C8J56DRAFT_1020517 [Mycena floridula]|nr:hypothetical protein C8J56DRAFT_1020517 [Mycena floridula]
MDRHKNPDLRLDCGDSDHLQAVKSLLKGKFNGIENPRVWSDIDDIKEITSLPDDRFHRVTDRYIQQVGETGKVKTSIMAPPDLFGLGIGPALRQSILLAPFVGAIKKKGAAFYYGEGTNRRSFARIHDLVDLYLLVLEDIVNNDGKKTTWGKEDSTFLVPQIAPSPKKSSLLTSERVCKPEDLSRAQDLLSSVTARWWNRLHLPILAMYMFASNSRAKADRTKVQLGYVPKGGIVEFLKSLEPEIDAALEKTERNWLA